MSGRTDAPEGGGRTRTSWSREARTNEDGIALLEALPAGPVRVRVREPGFLSGAAVPSEVLRGEIARVVLGEVPGRPMTVHVVDESGRSLPGAILEVSAPGDYAPLGEDDVQPLSLVTGPDGLRIVPRLPEGRVRVTARRGTAEGTGEMVDRDLLVVVLRRKRVEEDARR